MAFALQLQDSLRQCEVQGRAKLAEGDALGEVLARYLLAVEAAADSDMLTSILLLDGQRLRTGAAPNLPPSYCEAIDGVEIGPSVGSCGTAAYSRRSIYVTDIATDSLWTNYRDIALPHGLRACWSTPIFDEHGAVIGTFAIYHLTPRSPTRDEVQAILSITDHVARAISWSKMTGDISGQKTKTPRSQKPDLKLVADNGRRKDLHPSAAVTGRPDATALTEGDEEQDISIEILRNVARGFDAVGHAIDLILMSRAGEPVSVELEHLRRAKQDAEKGAAAARRALELECRGSNQPET